MRGALLFVLLIFFAPPALANSSLERALQFFQSIKSIEGTFSQFEEDAPVKNGYLWIQFPGKMRVDYENPRITVAINKNIAYYYDFELDELSSTILNKSEAIFHFLNIDSKNLSSFKTSQNSNIVTLERNQDGINCIIFISKNPLAVSSVEIKTQEGERIILKLTDVTYNKAIKNSIFTSFQ